MKNNAKPKLRLISETIPDEFITKPICIFDIFKATDEFFDENFRGAITVENELETDGYVNISPDGFAFFHKLFLNAIFGESVVRLKMCSRDGVFKVMANWKVYNKISKSDLALLSSTAESSGFKMTISENGDTGHLILEAPIKITPMISIYAVSAERMRGAFTRVFFC